MVLFLKNVFGHITFNFIFLKLLYSIVWRSKQQRIKSNFLFLKTLFQTTFLSLVNIICVQEACWCKKICLRQCCWSYHVSFLLKFLLLFRAVLLLLFCPIYTWIVLLYSIYSAGNMLTKNVGVYSAGNMLTKY